MSLLQIFIATTMQGTQGTITKICAKAHMSKIAHLY